MERSDEARRKDSLYDRIGSQSKRIKELEAENKSQVEHIKLLNQCDDSSTEVIGKMDIEIGELQAENKRMKEALQGWIDINIGAPNKYFWAEEALGENR